MPMSEGEVLSKREATDRCFCMFGISSLNEHTECHHISLFGGQMHLQTYIVRFRVEKDGSFL